MKEKKNSFLDDVQSLYAKEKKKMPTICLGDSEEKEYTEEDVIVLPERHILRTLLALPGIPYNKIIQIAGKKDTGKSTIASEVMIAAQKSGARVILVDSEDKFDAKRLKLMGGTPGEVWLIKNNEILVLGEAIRVLVHKQKKDKPESKILVVWDSVGASQSRSHAERQLDSEKHAQPGQDAKENGSVMKAITALFNQYPDSIAVYLANQTYAKIGFMQKGDQATGGAKIEYHSSLIVMLKCIETLKKTIKGVVHKTGIISRATVTKNHLTQLENSIHHLDFMITSTGSELLIKSKESSDDTDDGDEE